MTPSHGTGSGVVIEKGRILTGAHVVANATFLQVQRTQDPDKVIAHVVGICHDADLALLAVDADDGLGGVEPVEIGELPELRDRVSVVGFPVGGEEVSVTEGVVSRVEVQSYTHSQRDLLAVTVDAAINEGNSGGPVLKDGKVVGIAFQTLEDAESIGEMVPAPVIRHFLRGIDEQPQLELPGLGIATQNLENPGLRRKLGMPDKLTGVLVNEVEFEGSAWGKLQPGDALLAADGRSIANNGTVLYDGRYRTSYGALLGDHYVGDTMLLQLWRDGAVVDVELELAPMRYLVPRSDYDRPPSYFIWAGFVFQTLTRSFLATWSKWWDRAPKEFLVAYQDGVRTEERREIAVINQILAHQINVGYEGLHNHSVATVNGRIPKDMGHLVASIEAATGLVEITTGTGATMVVDAGEARAAGAEILQRYRIDRDRSADLR